MQFKREQSPFDVLSDKVTAALETGNPEMARQYLAEAGEDQAHDVVLIRNQAYREYGYHL